MKRRCRPLLLLVAFASACATETPVVVEPERGPEPPRPLHGVGHREPVGAALAAHGPLRAVANVRPTLAAECLQPARAVEERGGLRGSLGQRLEIRGQLALEESQAVATTDRNNSPAAERGLRTPVEEQLRR